MTTEMKLPPALSALILQEEARSHAEQDRAAAAARDELAALSDEEPRRLLAVAARLRGEAEALAQKAAAAKAKADEAHSAYLLANSAHGDRRTTLRRASLARWRLREAYDVCDLARLRLVDRYRLGTLEHRAAVQAVVEVMQTFRRDTLDALRDGAAEPPARPLLELIDDAAQRAASAGADAAERCAAERERAHQRAERRRLSGEG